MDVSWTNTREALRSFTEILTCGRCGKEPVAATRYTSCGHFFCKPCSDFDKCFKCGAPVRPTEIKPDFVVSSLVTYCNTIAKIVNEGKPWNSPGNLIKVPTTPVKKLSRPRSVTPVKKSNSMPKIGKNINKRDPKGETPLHLACRKGQEDRVKFLLLAGANPNTKDNAYWTPLQEVVSLGFTSICQLLLEAGACPNISGMEGRMPLHEAVIHNREAEAYMLLQYKARTNERDQCGKTPIDYCESDSMREILLSKCDEQSVPEKSFDLSRTLDQSFSGGQNKFVVFPSNLREENLRSLSVMAKKHKMTISNTFRSSVTHTVVEANIQNIVTLSYDVMMALLHGCWLLNSEWITLGIDMDDVMQMDLEVFEIYGAPVPGIPKKARENAQKENPRLFDNCHFYFDLQPKSTYSVGQLQLTKENLSKLAVEGGGSVLVRKPDPEKIKDPGQSVPFHTSYDPSHPLYKCTHYIVYAPGQDEPRIKYNMPHIKTLPLMWFIECIEKFTLVNPSYLGLI